ncbi:hypothetical protein [Streptomyces lancefieldiae]|uniref:Integral membrane protein n=1 Tax=Streptomyces lancefieldiae TaxID=3075520 RepID=A0ABU3AJN8_9ACTN|nr:hypothetical protein [Streptomyces sp. DSM 40712]MDT0610407.1 hypothetical protein [Streptomyces sp. DSM 40712]
MQAQRFGYAVSPSAAIDTEATYRHLADSRRRARRGLFVSFVVLAVLYGGGAVWVAAAGRPGWVLGALPFLLLPVVIVPMGSLQKLYTVSVLTRWVKRGPWQVWPCRMEALPDKAAVHRVLMLGPDGTVAREMWSRVPVRIWVGRTDGLGLLWFCGDLRFGGVFAEPGGSPVWRAEPPAPGRELGAAVPAASRDDESSIVADLAQQAARTVFGNLLGG